MALCITVGEDHLVVTVQSVPATVPPHYPHITTASQAASITSAAISQTITKRDVHPVVVHPTKTISTKKPTGKNRVSEAEAAVTSQQLTTHKLETTASPRPGITLST